jgi:hypothetical protein
MNYRQFPEILIKCHHHAALLKGATKYFLITGIFQPVAGINDIMARGRKFHASAGSRASVKQEFHATASVIVGSTRSCATTRWAYMRQARTSSGSIQEYPSRMVSGVSPAASIPSTCSTASRRPRNTGLPPKMSGLTVIAADRS